MVEIEFPKPRGKDPIDNEPIDLENFIAIKGIKALGNQLTTEKVKNINRLAPLPYTPEPIKSPEDIEVIDEEDIEADGQNKKPNGGNPESNTDSDADEPRTLFDWYILWNRFLVNSRTLP